MYNNNKHVGVVFLNVGSKFMLAALHEYADRTDRFMLDHYISLSARCSQRN